MKRRKWKRHVRSAAIVPAKPGLRFTASAWAKLEFFRDRGNSEIGGFGITSPEDVSFRQACMKARAPS